MKKKTKRLLTIKEIILKKKISSQDELLQILRKKGFDYTQATLSRDLKFLKITKIFDSEKGYIYSFMDEINKPEKKIGKEDIQVHGFQRFDFANNLGVVKTLPGFASSIAIAIDSYNSYEIVGTIAGDDTILIIPRDNITKNDIINVLIQIIPELKGKL
ncbi:MAG: hypothetical protein JXB49_11540 [Bacteroidales bacterium]|nr:hypothetical protein [Bacteroidales bacterium]